MHLSLTSHLQSVSQTTIQYTLTILFKCISATPVTSRVYLKQSRLKMNKYLIILLLLAGCSSTPIQPAPIVITKVERVVVLPPVQLLQPPPQVTVPNPDTSTQSDVAGYLVAIYGRMKTLDNQLIDLAKFFKDLK